MSRSARGMRPRWERHSDGYRGSWVCARSGPPLDVADGAALKAWAGASIEALGGLDIVISNVSALAIGSDEESWRAGFEIDMLGAVRLVDAVLPALKTSRLASIVTISSVSGREIDFRGGTVRCAQGSLIHYTQGLALQLAPISIRANSVSPGNTYFEGGVCIKSRTAILSSTERRWPSIRPAAWGHHRRWPTPWSSWQAQPRASSQGRTLLWMVH